VSLAAFTAAEPVYEEMPGWKMSTKGAREIHQLPPQAIAYVRRLEELVGARIAIISTGPERDSTIVLQNPFDL
jgi:adenylosuccinate synthase